MVLAIWPHGWEQSGLFDHTAVVVVSAVNTLNPKHWTLMIVFVRVCTSGPCLCWCRIVSSVNYIPDECLFEASAGLLAGVISWISKILNISNNWNGKENIGVCVHAKPLKHSQLYLVCRKYCFTSILIQVLNSFSNHAFALCTQLIISIVSIVCSITFHAQLMDSINWLNCFAFLIDWLN